MHPRFQACTGTTIHTDAQQHLKHVTTHAGLAAQRRTPHGVGPHDNSWKARSRTSLLVSFVFAQCARVQSSCMLASSGCQLPCSSLGCVLSDQDLHRTTYGVFSVCVRACARVCACVVVVVGVVVVVVVVGNGFVLGR